MSWTERKTDSGVTLLIFCKCHEEDIISVTRYMNKGVLQIFYRNGITVPFNTVTISESDIEERRNVKDLHKGDRTGEKDE